MPIARQPADLHARARAHGVWTVADLHSGGLSDDAIWRRVRSGDLVRLFRGVYLAGGLELTALARGFAAAIAAGEDAVPSHLLAAQVHKLWLPPRWKGPAETRGDRRRARRDGLIQHRPALQVVEVVDVGGLVVADAPTTVVDVTAAHGREAGVIAAESAVRRGLMSLRDIAGHPLASLVDPRSQSPLETHIRLLCRDAGITHLVPQVPVWDDDAWCERFLDLADAVHKVAVEADGRSVHGAPAAVYTDRARQNALVREGWIILRFTWWDVLERPGYVVRCIREALQARGWRAAA